MNDAAHSCINTRPFETIKNLRDFVLRKYFYKRLAQEFEYLLEYLKVREWNLTG